MTREEVLDLLDDLYTFRHEPYGKTLEALGLAIDELQKHDDWASHEDEKTCAELKRENRSMINLFSKNSKEELTKTTLFDSHNMESDETLLYQINKKIKENFKDIDGNPISLGSILVNPDGYKFEVKFGIHKMFCPVDEEYMDTLGVYCTNSLYSLEAFPLGKTHGWARLKGED